MKKNVCILQHEIDTPAGSVLQWLEERGHSFRIIKLFERSELPELSDFDSLFICGGSMNVDQQTKFPWMILEKKLILNSIESGKKVVGLCLGGQLIAEVLGGQVGPMGATEVGWHPIALEGHSLLNLKASEVFAFQWHSYCFRKVPQAKVFAKNAAWSDQAFTFKNNVLGFQFHPETTVDWAIECANDPKLPHGKFCQSREEIIAQLEKQKTLQTWFFQVLDSFFAAPV